MHFNRKNGSVVLPSFKAMIFRLRFLTPLVSPIIPRKATELLLSCVELIAFIDLMGPPRHFSKIVIENAAWQVSRSDRLEWVCEDGVRGRVKLAPYARGVQWVPALRAQTWGPRNTRGHETGVSFRPQAGLREGPGLGRDAGESRDRAMLLTMNPVSSKAIMGDFSGDPMVKKPHVQRRGCEFDPWSGN